MGMGLDIDFVLWDHDGVIVDTEPWFFEATRLTLLDFDVEVSREQWQRCQAKGEGLERVATAADSARLDFGEIRGLRDDRYEVLLRDNEVLIDGAVEALGQVSEHFRMALVTTSLRRFIEQLHDDTSVLDHFDCVITSEDCSRHKPDPEPYLRAMERLGATPARSVAVEDSPRGLQSAISAGLRCFVVRSEFMSQYRFDDAHAVLDHIGDLTSRLAI